MEPTLNREFDVELKQLLESINLKYGYDFRRYSPASMKRRVLHAMNRMGYKALSALQEKVIQDSDCFNDLLQSITIQVSEMFRDPLFSRTSGKSDSTSQDLPIVEDLGRRMQYGRRGLFACDPAS